MRKINNRKSHIIEALLLKHQKKKEEDDKSFAEAEKTKITAKIDTENIQEP